MPRTLLPVLLLLSLLLPNPSIAQEADTMPSPPAWLEELDALYDADLRVDHQQEHLAQAVVLVTDWLKRKKLLVD